MMIANYTHDSTDISRELVTAAFRFGYEGRVAIDECDVVGFLSPMEDLLRQMASQIHPSVYQDLRADFQRCSEACASTAGESFPSESRWLLHNFVQRCGDALPHDGRLAGWFRFGREIGEACCLARKEHNCPLNIQRLRKCVELIPQELSRTDDLANAVDSLAGRETAAVVPELFSNAIPAACRDSFAVNELPFHALFKLVTVEISNSGVIPEADGESAVSQNDEPYSDDPPPVGLFPYGPVHGKQKQIAHALGMDTRTMKDLHRRGRIWIHRFARDEYDVHFKSEGRYRSATRNMPEDSNGIE